jgi:hypothetical protein
VTGTDCASAGGHFDPYGVEVNGYTTCTGTQTERSVGCYMGDLSGKFSAISIPSKVMYSDQNLPLSGPNSIDGRSIVLHAADGEGARIACASVVTPAACVPSEWGSWSTCSAVCGIGTQVRTRHIVATNGLSVCALTSANQLRQERDCRPVDDGAAGPQCADTAATPLSASVTFDVTLEGLPVGPLSPGAEAARGSVLAHKLMISEDRIVILGTGAARRLLRELTDTGRILFEVRVPESEISTVAASVQALTEDTSSDGLTAALVAASPDFSLLQSTSQGTSPSVATLSTPAPLEVYAATKNQESGGGGLSSAALVFIGIGVGLVLGIGVAVRFIRGSALAGQSKPGCAFDARSMPAMPKLPRMGLLGRIGRTKSTKTGGDVYNDVVNPWTQDNPAQPHPDDAAAAASGAFNMQHMGADSPSPPLPKRPQPPSGFKGAV